MAKWSDWFSPSGFAGGGVVSKGTHDIHPNGEYDVNVQLSPPGPIGGVTWKLGEKLQHRQQYDVNGNLVHQIRTITAAGTGPWSTVNSGKWAPSPLPPPISKPQIETASWRHSAIGTRLRLDVGEKLPFDELETALGDDKVYVMIVTNGKGVMLEDDRALFPSDTLVTQLRLLAK
jgi:hypothetical protein